MRITVENGSERVVIDPSEPGGAAKSPAEHEQWDGRSLAGPVIKADAAKRFTLSVGYPAYKADVAVALDGHRDFAGEQATEEACWEFMKSQQVGLYHQDGTEGVGTIVENYVYRNPDPWVLKAADGSEQVIKAGDWLIGIIWDQAAWDLIQKGEINGTSMQGKARRRRPSGDALERVEVAR
jgi:Putative phage serine protease XkdF